MSKNKFYITTAILYTNGKPHLGFAYELILADVLARYHRLKGEETYFLTGTDEHGTTVARAAEKYGKTPIELADEVALQAQDLTQRLNVANDDFIRTSDQTRHWPTAIKFWNQLAGNGDLYKKEYEGLYCVGHEAFIKKNDLVDGVCPLHKTEPEKVKEENWFFKLTKYKDEIKKRIKSGEFKIVPASKANELLNLLDDAEDVSFSRPVSSLKWGIPVPNDPSQTMYVWADALTNYISALGYAQDSEEFKKYWPADIHLVGKDILRFHAMIWPAMLLSVGIELPKAVYVHGFINVDGQKMSKTTGNVVDPFAVVEKFGPEVTRYYLLREISSTEDGDFSESKLIARYNGDLANNLGNLVSRIMKLAVSENIKVASHEFKTFRELIKDEFGKEFSEAIENFQLSKALDVLFTLSKDDQSRFAWSPNYYVSGSDTTMSVSSVNSLINEEAPYKELDPSLKAEKIKGELKKLQRIATLLEPFMPDTSRRILELIANNSEPNIPLFPRMES